MGWVEWTPPWEKKRTASAVLTISDNSSTSGATLEDEKSRPQDMREKDWVTIDHLELVASHRSYYEAGGSSGVVTTTLSSINSRDRRGHVNE